MTTGDKLPYNSFFFSSRRRHTRLQGDWSSDVCSSDLPSPTAQPTARRRRAVHPLFPIRQSESRTDRKSTRLNSSHLVISYAVFCLKKKNHPPEPPTRISLLQLQLVVITLYCYTLASRPSVT